MQAAYRRAGNGPALVLAHGAIADGRTWAPQLEGLNDEFTVVAWDEPGAGRSPDAPAGFTLADFADALATVVETVGAPAHVGGISWGGMVALELATRRPELVRSLVLVDTYAGWAGSLPEEEWRARVAGVEAQLADTEGAPDLAFPGLFASGPDPRYAELLAQIEADVRPESMRVLLPNVATDLRDRLGQVAVPTLLVWGAEDVRSPLPVARQFHEGIPGSELVVIPGAGHLVNLERPDEFNAAVRAFCRAH